MLSLQIVLRSGQYWIGNYSYNSEQLKISKYDL